MHGAVLTAAGMVPPCDLEAEGALCAACLIAPRRAPDVLAALDPRDCYSGANRAILDAVRALHDAGEPVDVLTVRSRLNGSVPAEYLAQLMGSAPTIENLDAYGAIVSGKARQRRTIARLQQLAAEGYAAADADAWLAEVASSLAEAGPCRRCALPVDSTDEVFAPLPPVDWVAKQLQLAPGRPAILAAYGYSGKTVAAQALALAVAAGVPIWGRYPVRDPAVVVHLDFEQGRRATFGRYQRLARGMGLGKADLCGRLRTVVLPARFALDRPGAERILEDVIAEHRCGLLVIDSYKAGTPHTLENDSAGRASLDMLTRLSERTGCAFLVVHHSGKAPPAGGRRDLRETMRGSSGLFDAAGLVLVLQPSEDDARPKETRVRVRAAKSPADAAGGALEPFGLLIRDVVGDDGDEEWGLECRHVVQAEPTSSDVDAFERSKAAILELIRSREEIQGGVKAIRARVRCRMADVSQALEELIAEDKIENAGTKTRPVYVPRTQGGT